jgi:predicted TIM-barrel fold metal-dependent hydrolase
LEIVDSQVHIWAAETPERPWPAAADGMRPAAHRPTPITAESLLGEMQAAGVDRCIVVPPSWEGDRNDVVAAAAQRYPDRYRYIGRLDLKSPDARGWIANWRQNTGMLGLQLTFQAPLFWQPLVDGELDSVWPAAEQAGLPLTIYIPLRLLPLIREVARKHPRLTLVINHYSLAGRERDDAAFAMFEELLALAAFPNVSVKASCLPFYTTQPYPFPFLQEYIRRGFDAFGPRRFFWGTDLSRLPCSYRQGVTLFTEELPWLKGSDLEWVMGRGIRGCLGWRDE